MCAGKDEECFFEISHLLHNMLRSGGPRMLDCFKFRSKVVFSHSVYLNYRVTACEINSGEFEAAGCDWQTAALLVTTE